MTQGKRPAHVQAKAVTDGDGGKWDGMHAISDIGKTIPIESLSIFPVLSSTDVATLIYEEDNAEQNREVLEPDTYVQNFVRCPNVSLNVCLH